MYYLEITKKETKKGVYKTGYDIINDTYGDSLKQVVSGDDENYIFVINKEIDYEILDGYSVVTINKEDVINKLNKRYNDVTIDESGIVLIPKK